MLDGCCGHNRPNGLFLCKQYDHNSYYENNYNNHKKLNFYLEFSTNSYKSKHCLYIHCPFRKKKHQNFNFYLHWYDISLILLKTDNTVGSSDSALTIWVTMSKYKNMKVMILIMGLI